MINLLQGLNNEQKDAVISTEGPLLILAGAGSGKTKVITHRIAYILQNKLSNPEEILAVTFTNKASGEMKERVAKLLGRKSYFMPFMGTFHSICVRILRKDGHLIGISPNFIIFDSSDQLDLVKSAMKKLDMSIKDINPRTVLNYISSAKNKYIKPNDFDKFAEGYFESQVAKIYRVYEEMLKDNNALDFDNIINCTIDLLLESEETKARYNRQFKYILVDEYQDTNKTQYMLIQLFNNSKLNNICVVGDEDQSIYKFRGATIENILNFENDFPSAKVVMLEQNYRSTSVILDAAHSVIKKNTERKDKKLWTENGQGNLITVYEAMDEKDEGHFIAKIILESDPITSIGVLYRINAQSRALEEILLQYNIPYRLVGGIKFYERKEVKDIIAYLRLIYNPKDDFSLRRAINNPPRKIGAKTISGIEEKANLNNQSIAEYLLSEKDISSNLVKFKSILEDLIKASKEMNVFDLVGLVLKRSGYLEMLDDGTEENLSRIENLKELMTVAYKYKPLPPLESLQTMLEDIALIEQEEDKLSKEKETPRVTLMTVHAAKGLEFDTVIIAGMEETIFPHSRSYMDPSELEEERRLAYVAITRSRKDLFVTHAEKRMIWGTNTANPLSRFVEDIEETYIEKLSYLGDLSVMQESYSRTVSYGNGTVAPLKDDAVKPPTDGFEVGDKVIHSVFGEGRILSIEDGIAVINFGTRIGVKKLALEFAGLSKV